MQRKSKLLTAPQRLTIPSAPSGFLNIDKPAGVTSHDVVDILRKLYRMRRIGHAGTLDPCARGVLVAGLGAATKMLTRIQETQKEYEAEVTFGYSTDTQDFTGKKCNEKIPARVERHALKAILQDFTGEITQVTPAYSAVRHEGMHLYEMARRGMEIPVKKRSVIIYSIELLSVSEQPPYAKASFTVKCSKGTYIRTLCKDIGEKLGYPSHMSALTRLSVGDFRVRDAVTLSALSDISFEERLAKLIPMESI